MFEDNHIFILYSLLVSSEYSWLLKSVIECCLECWTWRVWDTSGQVLHLHKLCFAELFALNYCFSSFDSEHWLLCFQGNPICSCWWIGLRQLCDNPEVFQWRSQFLVSCVNIFFFRIWFSTSLSRHWMLNLLKVICGGTIMFVWQNQWNHMEWSV